MCIFVHIEYFSCNSILIRLFRKVHEHLPDEEPSVISKITMHWYSFVFKGYQKLNITWYPCRSHFKLDIGLSMHAHYMAIGAKRDDCPESWFHRAKALPHRHNWHFACYMRSIPMIRIKKGLKCLIKHVNHMGFISIRCQTMRNREIDTKMSAEKEKQKQKKKQVQ